jgi:MFS superfamily sulfate permease-like transporter
MAAVLFLIKPRDVVFIWKTNRLDIIPYLMTLLSSFAFGLEVGILMGVVASLLLVVYSMTRPRIHIQMESMACRASDPNTSSSTLSSSGSFGFPYLVVKPNQSIVYTSVEYLKVKVLKALTEYNATASASGGPRDENVNQAKFVLVMDGTHLFTCDSTFALALVPFLELMDRKRVLVVFYQMRPSIRRILENQALLASDLAAVCQTREELMTVIQTYYTSNSRPMSLQESI